MPALLEQVKEELKPEAKDDGIFSGQSICHPNPSFARVFGRLMACLLSGVGIFWVSKEEFFRYFTTVYLSASDMTAFKED